MNPPPGWIRAAGDRILVEVKALPGASKSEVAGIRDGALLVRLAAPPEKGKANDELAALLAKSLGLSKSSIILVAGAASRRKRISLPAEIRTALENLVL